MCVLLLLLLSVKLFLFSALTNQIATPQLILVRVTDDDIAYMLVKTTCILLEAGEMNFVKIFQN